MNRTITVKGTGSVSLKPDLTVITMTLKSLDKNYDRSMEQSAIMLDKLQKALENVGFSEHDLKNTSFNVNTEYESTRDSKGNYKSVFSGYACIHGLKLEFDFDTVMLSKVLGAIAASVAEPNLNVQFSVKDKEAACDVILKNAAENARKKAEILAEASKVTLGQLVAVDYNWGELNINSRTEYAMDAKCMAMSPSANMRFEPDDIDINDSVTFVWEII